MIELLQQLANKEERIGIGLMSGTSVDGVDVAIVSVKGAGESMAYQELAFENVPISAELRERIFEQFEPAKSSVDTLCSLNFELGEMFSNAAETVIKKHGFQKEDIDFIGSHGQTLYHIPVEIDGLVRSTLQLGEASIIAEAFNCPVMSDFRVRDMAAGGGGAPLVPYVDYLLFRSDSESIALQNIGGIGNVTYLPKGGAPSEVIAFDTGPGNMIMDEAIVILTNGRAHYDDGGEMAAKGKANEGVLSELLQNPYFHLPIPKSTGRELFGTMYTRKLVAGLIEQGLSAVDIMATVTKFTALTIIDQYERFLTGPVDTLIVSGGGAYNPTLLSYLREEGNFDVKTQEDYGLSSDSKEAVAFALLANESLFGVPNNLPSATGARKPVVLGKLTV
ncbi:anhydro-N-acetylmuramic acid kinase [Sutcliffiella halmapala]|uniref:anhydro-N-acetylmuramic acid kinase n=1 Tax=Sutcliffiella halmapala TaxID=79882 RepID=UPI000994CED5|nr:anhydro-N-acetylmuramic acid kinase [Sutcliffiella halmapala]